MLNKHDNKQKSEPLLLLTLTWTFGKYRVLSESVGEAEKKKKKKKQLHIVTGNDVTASFPERVTTLEPVYVFLVISVYLCHQLSQNSFSISLAFILAVKLWGAGSSMLPLGGRSKNPKHTKFHHVALAA